VTAKTDRRKAKSAVSKKSASETFGGFDGVTRFNRKRNELRLKVVRGGSTSVLREKLNYKEVQACRLSIEARGKDACATGGRKER